MAHSPKLETLINAAVTATATSMYAGNGDIGAALKASSPVHLSLNSSFLYRDKKDVRTNQSNKYVLAKLQTTGKSPKVELAGIATGLNLKGHCRIEKNISKVQRTSLKAACEEEIKHLGDAVFLLLGQIRGLRTCSQVVNAPNVKELCLDASIAADFEDSGKGVYKLKEFLPIETLLDKIQQSLGGTKLIDSERQKIAEAYDKLGDDAVIDVVIPTKSQSRKDETVFGKTLIALNSQLAEYRAALRALKKDPQDRHALNDILRLSYNFTTDVIPIVCLVISICDLKPIVFWCTVDEHWNLSEAFKGLPWSALGRKEKLQEYKSVINEARNSAFHHALPFQSTVEVNLSGIDLKAQSIRLFAPFHQKQNRGVRLKDQELLDILTEFSRAKERPVSTVFWEKNEAVMQATIRLVDKTLDTLILLRGLRKN